MKFSKNIRNIFFNLSLYMKRVKNAIFKDFHRPHISAWAMYRAHNMS
jgi:hypothetical protein